MSRAEIVNFETPDGYLLNGLWFGEDNVQTGFIFIHGLGSWAFSHHQILEPLINENTSALYFNNRGHDKVGKVYKKQPSGEYRSEYIGEAFEVFEDCIDDIQGAVNYLIRKNVKNIILVGHSTGCQKSIYYLATINNSKVSAAVLLCPVSDYAYSFKYEDQDKLNKALSHANLLLKQNKPMELMPATIWPDIISAQRLVSLNSEQSNEEIFSYINPTKEPVSLSKVDIPLLAVIAENDQYLDRPANQVEEWFSSLKKDNIKTVVAKGLSHGLHESGSSVSEIIDNWLKELLFL